MTQNLQDKPKVLKESKRRIKVDFERTDAKTRFKEKYISFFFLTKVVWFVFRLVLLVGISYIVLYPFFTKIAGSFMAPEDFPGSRRGRPAPGSRRCCCRPHGR